MLAPIIEGSRVLDLFCGTGSLGIEALSRGAKSAHFIDKSSESIAAVKTNLAHTKLSEQSVVIQADVHSAINKLSQNSEKFDIIFVDPPYSAGLVKDVLFQLAKSGIINTNGTVIVESDTVNEPPEKVECLEREKSRRYGRTLITFYKC